MVKKISYPIFNGGEVIPFFGYINHFFSGESKGNWVDVKKRIRGAISVFSRHQPIRRNLEYGLIEEKMGKGQRYHGEFLVPNVHEHQLTVELLEVVKEDEFRRIILDGESLPELVAHRFETPDEKMVQIKEIYREMLSEEAMPGAVSLALTKDQDAWKMMHLRKLENEGYSHPTLRGYVKEEDQEKVRAKVREFAERKIIPVSWLAEEER